MGNLQQSTGGERRMYDPSTVVSNATTHLKKYAQVKLDHEPPRVWGKHSKNLGKPPPRYARKSMKHGCLH